MRGAKMPAVALPCVGRRVVTHLRRANDYERLLSAAVPEEDQPLAA